MFAMTFCREPSPSATVATTDAMPMMIPSMVEKGAQPMRRHRQRGHAQQFAEAIEGGRPGTGGRLARPLRRRLWHGPREACRRVRWPVGDDAPV